MKTISDFQFGLTKSETNLTAVYFDFARISAIFSIIQWPWRLWHYSVFIDPTDLLFIPSWSFRSVSIRLFKHINQFPLMPVSLLLPPSRMNPVYIVFQNSSDVKHVGNTEAAERAARTL